MARVVCLCLVVGFLDGTSVARSADGGSPPPAPPGILSAAPGDPPRKPTQSKAAPGSPSAAAQQRVRDAVAARETPPRRPDGPAADARVQAASDARAQLGLPARQPTPERPDAAAVERVTAGPRLDAVPHDGDGKGAPGVTRIAASASYGARYNPAASLAVAPTYAQGGAQWVTVTNDSDFTWTRDSIRLGYHLYWSNGAVYNHAGWGSGFPDGIQAVAPGASVTVLAEFEPLPAGSFTLVWDLLEVNSATYFTSYGVPASRAVSFAVPHYAPTAQIRFPAYGETTATRQPEIAVMVQGDDTMPIQAEYEICDAANPSPANCRGSGWLTVGTPGRGFTLFHSWTPPANALRWNTTYLWHIRVRDASATTAWSPMSPLTTVVPSVEGASRYGMSADRHDPSGVGLARGNYTRQEQDAYLTGTGTALSVVRTYNSTNPAKGAFGVGWSSLLDMRMAEEPGGFVKVTFPDGRQVRYGANWDSTYVPAFGESSDVVLTSQRSYRTVDGTSYQFTADGRPEWIQSATGATMFFVYGADGRIEAIKDGTESWGRRLNFIWNVETVVAVWTSSRTWYYEYGAGTTLAAVYDPRGHTDLYATRYGYGQALDGVMRLTGVTRPANGNVTLIEYAGALARKVTFADGAVWTHDREPARSPNAAFVVRTTDPTGLATRSEFDARGMILSSWSGSEISSPENTRIWSYNLFGQVSSTMDENQNVTEFLWNSTSGRVSDRNVWRDDQGSVNTHWDYYRGMPIEVMNGRLTAVVDANGRRTEYAYHTSGGGSQGLVSGVTAADGGVTRFSYTCVDAWRGDVVNDPTAPAGTLQPCGQLRSVTDADGRTTTYEYNRFGDRTRTTTATGLVTDVFPDQYGQPFRQTVSGAGITTPLTTDFTYDPAGHLLTTTEPPVTNPVTGVVHQKRTTNTYDQNGNRIQVTDADLTPAAQGGDAPRATVYRYDSRDRATETLLNGQLVSKVGYGPMGEVRTSTDAKGANYLFTYDSRGLLLATWLLQYVNPAVGGAPRDVRLEARYYDDTGRLASRADAMNRWVTYTYTGDGLPRTETFEDFADPDTGLLRDIPLRSYTYDPAGNVLRDTRGGGTAAQVTGFAYDQVDRVAATTLDPGGLNRVSANTYTKAGSITASTISGGTTELSRVTQVYDPHGAVTASAERVGPGDDLVTRYSRDAAGRVLGITDPRGSAAIGSTDPPNPAYTTNYTYDVLGRQSVATSPPVTAVNGTGDTPVTTRPATTIGYNTYGEITHERDALGRVTTTDYDTRGRKTRVAHPTVVDWVGTTLYPVETWTYDNADNLTGHQDRYGQLSTVEYDARNRPWRTTQPAPGDNRPAYSVTSTYDDSGNVVSVIDSTGVQTLATYDAMDRMRTHVQLVRRPEGGAPARYTTTYRYDDLGRLLSQTSPAGVVTQAAYNRAGETTREQMGGRGATTYEYDAAGRPKATTAPDGRRTEYTYDGAGRTLRVAAKTAGGALATYTDHEYDRAGNPVRQTAARSVSPVELVEQRREFDALGRTTALHDGAAGPGGTPFTTRFGYDAVGNATQLTDAEGRVTRTAYNAWDLPLYRVEPPTAAHPGVPDGRTNYTYDIAGQLQSSNGQYLNRNYQYDRLGRLTREAGLLSGTVGQTYRRLTYDDAGNVASVASNTESQTFTYDDRGLMVRDAGTAGTTEFTYDADGRIALRTGPSATDTVGWGYSGADVSQVFDSVSGTVRTLTRDTSGRVTAERQERPYGGPLVGTRAYTYDAAGRPSTDTTRDAQGGVVVQQAQTFDGVGNVTSRTTAGAVAGTRTENYRYDAANRLVGMHNPGSATGVDYTWDKVGNRTAVTKWEGTPAAHTVTGGTTYAYDERNRVLSSSDPVDGTTSYTWRPSGTLASTTHTKVGQAPTTTAQIFDALGRMTGDGSRTYTYDGLDRLARVTDQPTGESRNFAYSGTDKEPASDGRWWFSRSGDRLLGMRDGSPDDPAAARYAPVANGHQDIVALTDPVTGTAVGSRAYDPFGKTTDSTGAQSPIGFQGSWSDTATGKTQAQSRWYDPATGAFTSRDSIRPPIGSAASANLYGYGEANPTSYLDPTGHWKVPGTNYNIGTKGLEKAAKSGVNLLEKTGKAVGNKVVEAAKSPTFRARVWTAIRGIGAVACAAGCPTALVVGAIVVVAVIATGALIYVIVNADGTVSPTETPTPQDLPAQPRAPEPVKPSEPTPPVEPVKPPPPPPPPPPPVITGTSTTTYTNSWSTVGKWYDDTFAYARTDSYTYHEIHKWTYWSNGGKDHEWRYWTDHFWRVTKQQLINLADPIALGTVAAGTPPGDPGGNSFASEIGICGAGGSIETCGAGLSTPAQQLVADCQGTFGPDAFADCRTSPDPSALLDPASRLSDCTGPTGAGVLCGEAAGTKPKAVSDSCGPNSFVPGTEVLMADGKAKPIENVRVGDWVMAADPETGVAGPRKVTHLIVGHGEKRLVRITFDIEPRAGPQPGITATTNHPFWSPSQQRWVDAGTLRPGDTVSTPEGTEVRVAATRIWSQPGQRVHNLTVGDLHTYYVVAGTTPVLVHNATCTLAGVGKPGDLLVLGSLPDTEKAQAWPTHLVLSDPAWTLSGNMDWIRAGAAAGRTFYLATPMLFDNLWDRRNDRPRVYRLEIDLLLSLGYTFSADGLHLVPSGGPVP
ncbi:polymorphic toxin-type HINT domain-containing protein [Streptomycetaceae bacterium NBC_01309]